MSVLSMLAWCPKPNGGVTYKSTWVVNEAISNVYSKHRMHLSAEYLLATFKLACTRRIESSSSHVSSTRQITK